MVCDKNLIMRAYSIYYLTINYTLNNKDLILSRYEYSRNMAQDGTPGFERRAVLKAAGALGAFAGLDGVVSASSDRNDQFLVGYDDSIDVASAASAITSALPRGTEIVKKNETLGYVKVELPDTGGVASMVDAMATVEAQPGIEFTEEIIEYYALGYTPNDPRFDEQYTPQQVDAPDAWNTTFGSMHVTIAIVDQGVDYEHPNLEARFDDYKGEDFVDGNPTPMPVNSHENHGTHVAGIAAATTDNGEGTAGISNCRLLSGRALGADGSGTNDGIADAIQWAADEGADVINMSLGGPTASTILENAIDYAYDSGSLPVAAAGNGGSRDVGYPAALDNCVAVSAVDEHENLASFSDYGPEITVTAGGVAVLSTVNDGQYQEMSGTSMSCPVAAGVAGLGKSAYPNLSVDELWGRLEETSVDIGLNDEQQGAGLVNAANIVEDGEDDDDEDDDDDNDDEDDNDDDPGEPGECGDETTTASAQGDLSGGWWGGGSDAYTYAPQTADPCQATITLDGPWGATFDLYLTLDGRTPSTWDYDEASLSWGADEQIEVDLDGSEEFGILVDAYSGSGSYTLAVEELGK